MRNVPGIALIALLAGTGCNSEPQLQPVEQTAPADQIPEMTPPLEQLQPDTVTRPDRADTLAPALTPPTPATTPARDTSSGSAPVEATPTATPGAQQDGAAVLQRASTAYADVRSMKADFVMHFNNPLLRQQTTSRGTLHQRRPDRIALHFTDPAGDVLLSDGQFFWIYYPSIDAKQVIRCPAAAGGDQGVDLQAQFVGDPVRRFRYTMQPQESVGGRPAHVLTLEPRERTEYRTLKVWLDTRDALARRFEITEQNGSVRRFDLTNLEVNPTISDATFRFTPPDGARVVSCS